MCTMSIRDFIEPENLPYESHISFSPAYKTTISRYNGAENYKTYAYTPTNKPESSFPEILSRTSTCQQRQRQRKRGKWNPSAAEGGIYQDENVIAEDHEIGNRSAKNSSNVATLAYPPSGLNQNDVDLKTGTVNSQFNYGSSRSRIFGEGPGPDTCAQTQDGTGTVLPNGNASRMKTLKLQTTNNSPTKRHLTTSTTTSKVAYKAMSKINTSSSEDTKKTTPEGTKLRNAKFKHTISLVTSRRPLEYSQNQAYKETNFTRDVPGQRTGKENLPPGMEICDSDGVDLKTFTRKVHSQHQFIQNNSQTFVWGNAWSTSRGSHWVADDDSKDRTTVVALKLLKLCENHDQKKKKRNNGAHSCSQAVRSPERERSTMRERHSLRKGCTYNIKWCRENVTFLKPVLCFFNPYWYVYQSLENEMKCSPHYLLRKPRPQPEMSAISLSHPQITQAVCTANLHSQYAHERPQVMETTTSNLIVKKDSSPPVVATLQLTSSLSSVIEITLRNFIFGWRERLGLNGDDRFMLNLRYTLQTLNFYDLIAFLSRHEMIDGDVAKVISQKKACYRLSKAWKNACASSVPLGESRILMCGALSMYTTTNEIHLRKVLQSCLQQVRLLYIRYYLIMSTSQSAWL